ncbi:uncharacterized protein EDB91DRAFT_1255212 [Suillus paluster]|uniref:uncharacterized protein n=1 Tax=Suillus paluster TaxID=48578 RepID=UPI001B865448|nr:uncharacterized protein EDB91DRAFT_1255212 [Suillus paluster]KAG1724432.1 hypothetical protein EDB91DRAFT_1255212 [Suillus paluster]
MSNTDSDSFVNISSFLGSGSDISKDQMKTDVVSPSTSHGHNEEQLTDLPNEWKVPSDPRLRGWFTFCGLFLRQPDLEELWQEVRKANGWKKYNQRLRDAVMWIQEGHVLLRADMHVDPVLLHGVCYSASFKFTSAMMEAIEDAKQKGEQVSKLMGLEVLCHVGCFRMIRFSLAYSSAFLAGGLCMVALGVNGFIATGVAITVGILSDATFMKKRAKDKVVSTTDGFGTPPDEIDVDL